MEKQSISIHNINLRYIGKLLFIIPVVSLLLYTLFVKENYYGVLTPYLRHSIYVLVLIRIISYILRLKSENKVQLKPTIIALTGFLSLFIFGLHLHLIFENIAAFELGSTIFRYAGLIGGTFVLASSMKTLHR